MPIESAATMLVKTPQNPAGISRSVYRWHGSITRTVLINAAVSGTGIMRQNGMLTLTGNIYCDEDCSIDFSNTTFDLQDKVIYIHPDADIHWQDVLFYSDERRDGPNVTIFPEWGRWNADGGGILGTQAGANSKDRMHCFVGLISNVQIRQDTQSNHDIQYLPFLSSGTYRNVKALRVEGMNMNGNTDVANQPIIMHDCEFRASNSTGSRVGPLNNGSMILNDCIFGRMDGGIPTGGNNWMWDNVAPHVTRVPHHIYFCGKTKTRWSETWGRGANDTHLRSHQGGLRYYQVYKEGQVFGGGRHRLYSSLDGGDLAARKSKVTFDNNEMLELPSTAIGADGKFDFMTVKKTRINQSNSWNTVEQTGHIYRWRERTCIFQDVIISDPTVSVGRPDTPVPFVVQPDPHFDTNIAGITLAEIDDRISLNFNTKTITMMDNTSLSVKDIYSYLKTLHAEYIYFDYHMDMHFDGHTLHLEDWSLAIGDNCSLTLGGGSRILSIMGTITHGATFHNAGVELIDVNGISVFVGSTAPGARAVIKYGTNDPIYADVENDPDDNTKNPWSSLIPINTDVTVVVKAPGYSYERYEFNTGNQTVLDARLPREPTIDLTVSYTNAERDAMEFQNRTTGNTGNSKDLEDGWLEIELTGQVQLRDQLKKSRRIFDWHMSQNNGLLFLLNYQSEISGDPLNGRAFVYESDRMRLDCSNTDSESKIRWIKFANTRADVTSRWGDPVWLPTGSDDAAIYVAPATRRSGKVIFDNVIIQGRVGEAVVADAAQRLAENTSYTNALAKAAWDYLHTNTLIDNSFGKLVKTNLDARVSQVEGGSGGGTTNTQQQSNLGYFRIGNRIIAGGGISNRLIEAQGTGVHPHQLFLVSKTPHNNSAELQIYDVSGGDDGEQFYGQAHIPWLTADTPIDAACIDEDYLYLAIQNPANSINTIHRIPIDQSADSTTTYVATDVGFRVRAMCINGSSLVMARVTSSTIRLFTLPLPLASDATGPQVINHPDTDHAGEYMGMALVGSGTDQVLAVCSGTRRILEFSPDDYSHIDNYDLDFDSMGMIWWQDRPWTVRRHDADNFYLQPLELDYTAIRQEYLANLIRSNPQKTWEISDDDAHHTDNSIGAALLDMIVDYDLKSESSFTETNLAKLANLDVLVSSRLADTDYTTPPTTGAIKTALEASGSNLAAIKSKTDKINFNTADDVKATLDGEKTTTDDASRLASKATGFATPANVTDARDNVKSAITAAQTSINTNIDANETKIDTIDTVVDGIKAKTDKINFNTADDVKATLDSEPVTPATAPPTAAQIKTELEASGSSLAGIKAQTDKINFSGTGADADNPFKVVADAGDITVTGDVNVDLTSVTDKLDEIIEQVKQTTWDADGDPNTDAVNTLLGNLIAIKTRVGTIPTTDSIADLGAITTEINKVVTQLTQLTFDNDDDPNTENIATVLKKINNIISSINDLPTTDSVADLSELGSKIDDVKAVVDLIPQTSYTDTLTAITTSLTAINNRVNSIPTDAKWTLEQISDAVRDMADYDDDEGTTTSLKAVLDEILSDLLTLEKQLLLDTVDSNDTLLKRLKDGKIILDKFRFTNNDVKATLDGEKTTTDDASRLASKATGFATPANVTDARDNVKSAITAAQTSIEDEVNANEGKIDTAIADIGTVDTVVDGIKAKTDKLSFNTADDVKATLDGEKTTTDDASRLASKATGFATPANVTDARDNVKSAITAAQTSINTNIDANETKIDTIDTVVDGIKTETDKIQTVDTNIDAVKARTDKLLFEGETATGGQEKLHTFTDVEVTLPDNTEVTVNLSTVEDGIEDIQNQLKTRAGEGETATVLDKLVETGADVEFIRQMQEADIEITDRDVIFKVSGSDTVLARWLRRQETTRADYSGGRVTPDEQ